ncbi:hypothetical protein IQ265_27010 [Nodosilinea sp. LEGE 06152]|uniref:hypothetical protein n=1 Tax=Nodosilinea sp. LEGE 06152 TaxID=2777966 RepID=UPI00187EF579|nr:hypothetical protein [Nodosilinea sp. LEGE 06152]MBE9160444.1 hypothetical protein [Nodosilinea sp. LEGE 06152]
MISFPLNPTEIQQPYPSAPAGIRPIHRPLKNRWRNGRGYAVIALIAPLLLGSLLLIHLQNTAKTQVNLWRL